jgi:hypothetical protein
MRERHTLCRADAPTRPVSSPLADLAGALPPVGATGTAPAAPTGPLRYGYRPGIAGRRLHCVLPGGPLDEHRGRIMSWAWCGAAAYLDNGQDSDWGHWQSCRNCVQGYQRHLILRLLAATAQSTVTEHALVQQLPTVPVHERLTNLLHEGVVARERGPNGHPLYCLVPTSRTAIGYRSSLLL